MMSVFFSAPFVKKSIFGDKGPDRGGVQVSRPSATLGVGAGYRVESLPSGPSSPEDGALSLLVKSEKRVGLANLTAKARALSPRNIAKKSSQNCTFTQESHLDASAILVDLLTAPQPTDSHYLVARPETSPPVTSYA